MKDYLKYKQWLEKKSDYTTLMCYESNFIDSKKKLLGGLIQVLQLMLSILCRAF